MAKQNGGSVLHLLAWFTGVVVSLAVGNGLIDGLLGLPTWLGGATTTGMWISVAIGWIVVITTIVSAVMALLKK